MSALSHPELDTVVVGAGVVGLAVGRAIALSGREVVVVDRHSAPGMETSSRSSEVIHAGLYYPAGSLKAKLCVAGRDALYRYADERGIKHRRCGKLIIASGSSADEELSKIERRSEAAGAGALKRLSKADIASLEPVVRADAGLLSSKTGIIDSHALMLAYLSDMEAGQGMFVPNTVVTSIRRAQGIFSLTLQDGETVTARCVVNAAGLHSGHLASIIEPLGDAFKPRIRYARGVYFRPSRSPGFNHLVYPLPTNASLGVHATLDLAGKVRFGPDVEWIVDPTDYSVDPDRGWEFREAISEYWPGIADTELVPDYAGIRPKLVGPDEPAADFRIDGPADHGIEGLVCLHGIESPGLTASLPLGVLVARRLAEAPLRPTRSLLRASRAASS